MLIMDEETAQAIFVMFWILEGQRDQSQGAVSYYVISISIYSIDTVYTYKLGNKTIKMLSVLILLPYISFLAIFM